MPLAKFNFKPGINKEETDYSNEGGWVDANFIRFRKNRVEKIGGWLKASTSSILGRARALHQWVSLAGTRFMGIGTTLKYYIEQGGAFNDITPLRVTTSAGDVTFAKVANGDATITVTDSSHGAVVNDFVTFSGADSLGGNIILRYSTKSTRLPLLRVPMSTPLKLKILMAMKLQLLLGIQVMVAVV